MNFETEQQIYNMLTESTGTHFLDSGGGSGRHWQQNKKRTLEDFKKDKVFIYEPDDIYSICKSVFHHLVESVRYNKELNEDLENFLKASKEDNWRVPVEQYLQLHNKDKKIDHINTYNEECVLSQTLQIITIGDMYENETVALSIHNGADVRGGYTDFKIFDIDTDMFYMWHPEHYDYLVKSEGVGS
jgi:hypothetical protein